MVKKHPTIVSKGLMLAAICTLWACSAQSSGGERIPTLNRFSEQVSERLPEPPPPVDAEGLVVGSVESVIRKGCSTTVVKGLSLQIIAEANCLKPNSYARVPALKNMRFGDAVFPFMRKRARDALVKAVKKGRRHRIKFNSMLRTVAQQFLLHEWYRGKRCGIKLAALPGRSNHQSGLAIDISSPQRWRRRLQRAGFRWLGKRDRWHFDFVGSKKRRPQKNKGLDIRAFQRLWNRNHPTEAIAEDSGWGDSTEDVLRRAPADGFRIGPSCTPEAAVEPPGSDSD